MMHLSFFILSLLGIAVSILPLISHQHWFFRIWEFARIQVFVFQITVLALGLVFFEDKSFIYWITVILNLGFIVNHSFVLFPYTSLYKKNLPKISTENSDSVSVISVNVYQFNKEYDRLISLLDEVKPDILLTMESNKDWENALIKIEKDYPNFKKVPLENTYGIHLYTKLKVENIKVNYFIADDLPSIEATLFTNNGDRFTFYGVHPPPPSPTEENTSKERDGELLAVAKKVKETKGPVIVVGDFNNVAWARSSILFRKTSELIDSRIGRGFVSTFHANYWLLKFPIDLFFHSSDVFIKDLKTLRSIGSDHLPLYSTFFINKKENLQDEEIETLQHGEKEEVDELIEEGIEQNGNRQTVAEE